MCVLAENKEDVEKFASFTATASAGVVSPVKVDEAPKKIEKAAVSTPQSAPMPVKSESKADNKRIFASPLAKTLAAEKGIKLSDVKGTGPLGRVLKNDILNFKQGRKCLTSSSRCSNNSFICSINHLWPTLQGYSSLKCPKSNCKSFGRV
jgi:pyruvate dehydrogenase E2 component (dihydrolipoamide acetyltransferase)